MPELSRQPPDVDVTAKSSTDMVLHLNVPKGSPSPDFYKIDTGATNLVIVKPDQHPTWPECVITIPLIRPGLNINGTVYSVWNPSPEFSFTEEHASPFSIQMPASPISPPHETPSKPFTPVTVRAQGFPATLTEPNRIQVTWTGPTEYSHFNVRWWTSDPRAASQVEVNGGHAGSYVIKNTIPPGLVFTILVQGCDYSGLFGYSNCTQWSGVSITSVPNTFSLRQYLSFIGIKGGSLRAIAAGANVPLGSLRHFMKL